MTYQQELDLILAPFELRSSDIAEVMIRSTHHTYPLYEYEITTRSVPPHPPLTGTGHWDLPSWILKVEWTLNSSLGDGTILDLSFQYAPEIHENLYRPPGRNWFKR